MSGSWDAMIAHEIAQGSPIVAVPGVAPSEPRELPVFSSQAGLQAFRRPQTRVSLPRYAEARFSLVSPV